MNFSHDYSEPLNELKKDIENGELKLLDKIKVVRTRQTFLDNYQPIIYYYHPDDETDGEPFEEMLAKDTLLEMEEWNRKL